MGFLAVILFLLLFVLILKGYPVAITLGGVSTVFALAVMVVAPDVIRIQDFYLLPTRFMGTINNTMLMAIPLFIFMGIMLEKSGLAETLLQTMADLFGSLRGGLAIAVIIVGALLAASTGIVGATVVTMGSISLPVMLKRGYHPALATGVIASSGTLGQIIPPSIVLILLADQIGINTRGVAQVDVGTLFKAAILPGLLLVIAYILYVLVISQFKKDWAPAVDKAVIKARRSDTFLLDLFKAFILPLSLILAVLGSILAGITSPTEAAAVGALVFRTLGGDDYLIQLIESINLSAMGFLLIVMFIMFISGFFIDFIEIVFIFIPVVVPIFNIYEIDLLWVAVLMAINLQTSFLTPPFGFSLFYLKGVAPPEVTTAHLYRGIIPYIVIQVLMMILLVVFPDLIKMFI